MVKNKTILDVLAETNEFNKLIFAIRETGLDLFFTQEAPYTLLAPYDEAFLKLKEPEVIEFIENSQNIKSLLKYHLIPGILTINDLLNFDEIQSVEGDFITIDKKDGMYLVNDCAKILRGDINASNGIIHIIDNVLIPKIYSG